MSRLFSDVCSLKKYAGICIGYILILYSIQFTHEWVPRLMATTLEETFKNSLKMAIDTLKI